MKDRKGLFAVCLVLVAMFLISSVALAESKGPIDINQCSVEELCALKGIDTEKASAIVEYREGHGPFTSIEDIKNVKGIEAELFENIKELITVTKAH